jgi:tetratricopeptide (TPR) repeat protein
VTGGRIASRLARLWKRPAGAAIFVRGRRPVLQEWVAAGPTPTARVRRARPTGHQNATRSWRDLTFRDSAHRHLLLLLLLLAAALLPLPLAAQQRPDIAGSYHRSYELERAERFQDAIRALAPVYDAYPNGYTVNLRMGWLFYLNGNYNNAVAHYEVATTAAPAALEPKLGRLLPLLAQERWADAEVVAYQIVSVDHYNYYGNLRLAIALRMQKKLEPAYQIALKMVRAYPTDIYYLVELALVQDARGDAAEARRLFGEILILDPANETARRYLAGRES